VGVPTADELDIYFTSSAAGGSKTLVLLDFSKAFDSVCHGLFVLKLRQRYGFHATAAALVSSYLSPRYQKVACGNNVSPLAPLVASVLQGSPISRSFCFSLFIDDMTEVLGFSKYHMYADDLQICHSRPRKSFLIVFVRLTMICQRFLNPSKSMVLPIYRNHIGSSYGAFSW
jgi:hypothetical protein